MSLFTKNKEKHVFSMLQRFISSKVYSLLGMALGLQRGSSSFKQALDWPLEGNRADVGKIIYQKRDNISGD